MRDEIPAAKNPQRRSGRRWTHFAVHGSVWRQTCPVARVQPVAYANTDISVFTLVSRVSTSYRPNSKRIIIMSDLPIDALYRDPAQPVDVRVKDLISRMTLEEKVQQMIQNEAGFVYVDVEKSPEVNAEKFRQVQDDLRTKTRLGIPALTGNETLHGLMLQGATIYPQAIALGSTWNPELVKEMAEQIAKETSAVGITQALAPILDLGRDPRYGRIEECYGECPYLVSRFGVAYIKGLQGENAQEGLAPGKVYCMLKHFAGYSVPANGINIAPVLVGEIEMRTHHLIPVEAAVKEAHVMSVMPSYNSVDSIPSHASRWLLTDVLRKEWGFQGYVYSDWGGIEFLVGHRIAKNNSKAGVLAVKAGVDIEAPSPVCYKTLAEHVMDGSLEPEVIDRAVSRILRAKFLAGLFDGKRSDGGPESIKKVFRCPEHIATARKLADESIILLKNDRQILPLDPAKLKSVAVIGPNAAQCQFGDYSWSKANRDGVNLLQALQTKHGKAFKINYAKGCDLANLSKKGFAEAVKAAEGSDIAVVVIGDTSMIFTGVGWEDPTLPDTGTVGEGYDVNNPVPPGVQEDLVKAIVETGKPTIVVLLNGRPYCLPWMHANVPVIVEAFYPGEQQGNAIVDILFGKVNPSGRLPVTLARSAGHIPCTYDFKGYGRGFYRKPGAPDRMGRDYVFDTPEPLWPFGFGLSYSTFTYSNLQLESTTVKKNRGTLKLSFEVKNTGSMTGKVVPQVYWRLLKGIVAPPEKRLLRFDKVELKPGESRMISYRIPVKDFSQLTLDNKWSVEPASIEIQICDNAEDIKMKQVFTIG